MSTTMLCFHFLVAVCVLVTLVRTDPASKDVCDEWANVALKVTGSGRLHKCSTRSSDCTIMDCSGSTTFSRKMFALLQQDIDLSYCFGMQMNACNDPISMDFYLQLPSRNISKVYRITNDDAIELKELNFSLGSIGTVYPLFNFQFERGDTKTVNLSVTARLKSSFAVGDILLEGFKFTLINDQVIPVKPCGKITPDSSNVPPTTFAPNKCQVQPYVPTSTVSPSGKPYVHASTVSPSGKPSDTLNKACDMDHKCAAREVCSLTSSSPKCICNPEFFLSPKGDACLSSSKINQTCYQSEECGYNEECRGDASKTCQCIEHHVYSRVREACVIPLPGYVTEHPVTNQPLSSTTATIKAEPLTTKAPDNKHTIAMSVGGGLAALVVIALIIVGLVCYKRRRQRPLSISDRESSARLIGNDDDNLIM
ncbi:hypothetical protein BsWGS_21370 [Bradybaena similaris]